MPLCLSTKFSRHRRDDGKHILSHELLIDRMLRVQKQKRKVSKHVASATEDVPKIDNIEYVGTFMNPYGKLSNVIQKGQLSALRCVSIFQSTGAWHLAGGVLL